MRGTQRGGAAAEAVARMMIVLGAVGLLGFAVYRVGIALSSDAIGLALGVVMGVMSSVPGALLVLLAARRQQAEPRCVPPPTPPPPTIVYLVDARGNYQELGISRPAALPDGRRVLIVDGHARHAAAEDD